MKELYSEAVYDESLNFWHRGPADVFVGDEMKTYKALLGGAPYKTVLDVGGHIGWFARYSLNELGAEKVVSVEPSPNNAEVFLKNFENNSRVRLIQAGVTSDGSDHLTVQFNPKYPANNRTDRPIRGRKSQKVPAIDFVTLLNEVSPDLLKIDIEGAEYGLEFTIPDCVRAVAIEYHQFDEYMLEEQIAIDSLLIGYGFRAVKAPKNAQTFQKITTGVYLR